MSKVMWFIFATLASLALILLIIFVIYPTYRAPGAFVLEAVGVPALRPVKPQDLPTVKLGESGIQAWNDATRISYGSFEVNRAIVPCRITVMRHPAIDHRYVVAVVDTTSASLGSTTGGYTLSGRDEVRLAIGIPLSNSAGNVVVDLLLTTDRVIVLKGTDVDQFLQYGLRQEDVQKLRDMIGDVPK